MFNKKPLLYAGICGAILIVFSILVSLSNMFISSELFYKFEDLFSLILSVFFMYGFYHLGLKYKSKLLSIVSIICIFLAILIYFLIALNTGRIESDLIAFNQTFSQQQSALDVLNANNTSVAEISVLNKEIEETLVEFIVPYIVYIGLFFILVFILSIVFDIALIGLKKVKYAKITGIIGLVSLGLFLTIFGIFLAIPLVIAYYVMLIIILFNEAKKFKEYR